MLKTVPLVDFAPDLESPTPGIIVDPEIAGITDNVGSLGFIPLSKGFGCFPSLISVGASALSTDVQGGAVVILTSGGYRVLAGTETKLYEYEGTTVLDRSRGGGYASGDNRWRFAAYGDIVYATNKADAVQKSTGAAFADILTIPKCTFMDRVGDFLIIAGTNETTYGDQADRWWCSALGNPDDFAPAISTQCVTNRLTDSAGPITASKALGDDWIIYKKSAVYRGVYQGPPDVWDFQRVSDDVGTLSHEGVVKVGFSHFFIGNDDFYRFDGAVPVPIPNNVKEWFFNRLEKDYAYKIQGYYDRYSSIIYWFYPGPTYDSDLTDPVVGDLTHYVAVNLRTGKWGAGKLQIEAVLEYLTGGMTYDEFYPPTGSTTWDALPAITYDSLLFVGGSPVMAVVRSDHLLMTASGAGRGQEFTVADFGDDVFFSSLMRVIPRYLTLPASAIAYYAYRNNMGAALSSPPTAYAMSDGRFYPGNSARWHRLGISTGTVDAVLAQLIYDLEEDGEE